MPPCQPRSVMLKQMTSMDLNVLSLRLIPLALQWEFHPRSPSRCLSMLLRRLVSTHLTDASMSAFQSLVTSFPLGKGDPLAVGGLRNTFTFKLDEVWYNVLRFEGTARCCQQGRARRRLMHPSRR